MKILLGGSPCTKWSIAQKNREIKCEGEGWELFKNFLIIKDLFKPDYFLYENNQSASLEIKKEIETSLNAPRYDVNSNLFSAQSRARFYVTNIPNIEIPKEQSSLTVKDIINFDNNEPYIEKEIHYKDIIKTGRTGLICLGHIGNSDSQGNRVYSIEGKSCTLCANSGGLGAKTGLYLINNKVRKLTPDEARKLQTIPDWVKFPVSDTQIFKQLGNGWTIDVIKNFLKNIPNIQEEKNTVVSIYDGMGCGYIALKEIGANIDTYTSIEIDKYCNKTLDENIPNRIAFQDAFDIRNPESDLFKHINKI